MTGLRNTAALAAAIALVGISLTAQTIHPKGTTIWKPLQARNGVTFIAAPDGTARLINMRGDLLNTWGSSDDPLLVKVPIFASPGHILAARGAVNIPTYLRPRGSIITEYDYDGNTVWEFTAPSHIGGFQFGGFHHDMVRLENGNTLVMASVLVDGTFISDKTLLDDCLLEINRNGEIVWAWFTFQHFTEFDFNLQARTLIWAHGGDWAHANAVTVIPPNDHGDPRFAAGNLVVSYRNLNTIIVIDKTSGGIVWKAGPNDSATIGQHFAHMIPHGLEGAGRILAFDNGGSGGFPNVFREYSRVIEIDPVTRAVPWTYTASKSGFQNWSFFSPFISGAQRLGAGNTLIVEGTKGRLFEVTAAGAIVWEYMSPFTENRFDGGVVVQSHNVYRAYRLSNFWRFFGVPPHGGV